MRSEHFACCAGVRVALQDAERHALRERRGRKGAAWRADSGAAHRAHRGAPAAVARTGALTPGQTQRQRSFGPNRCRLPVMQLTTDACLGDNPDNM